MPPVRSTSATIVLVTTHRSPGPVNAVYVEREPPAQDRYELLTLFERHGRELHGVLNGLEHCHNHGSCWAAGVPAQQGSARRGPEGPVHTDVMLAAHKLLAYLDKSRS
jgi:hypothetical protein